MLAPFHRLSGELESACQLPWIDAVETGRAVDEEVGVVCSRCAFFEMKSALSNWM